MDEPFLPAAPQIEAGPSWRRQCAAARVNAGDTIITTPPACPSFVNLLATLNRRRILQHRSHSAPSVFTNEIRRRLSDFSASAAALKSDWKSSAYVIRQAAVAITLYAAAGIALYFLNPKGFRVEPTYRTVDALYYSVVTLCTVGYGDIVPITTFTKLCTCAFILVGLGIFDILLNGLVSGLLDRQEAVMLSTVDGNLFNAAVRAYLIDSEKGRLRIRMKVGLAVAVVAVCVAVGTVAVHSLERRRWVDSFYLSITSVTTVGYGDNSFKTAGGRSFAIVWLLVSTFAVAKAYLYLTEFRIERRNRVFAKRVLQRKMTLGDLVAADLDNDGSISRSEYIIYKLKEMGKIAEKDVVPICNQFDTLDNTSCGKITMADIMRGDSSTEKS